MMLSQLFKKDEWISVIVIFAVLISAIYINLQISIRKSRDSQRKSDIRQIHDGLKAYFEDYGHYPASENGKIIACSDGKPELDDDGLPIFRACEWLYDSLSDRFDLNYPAYIEKIPTDPHHNGGARYYYLSNGLQFQIYASLEARSEVEYDREIEQLTLPCGTETCNFGRTSNEHWAPLNTPLSITAK